MRRSIAASDIGFYERLGYPAAWLRDSSGYEPLDSYVRYDPAWSEALPDVPDCSIYDLFARTAAEHADAIAIVFLGRSFTYAELHGMIDRFAAFLHDRGVGKGDYVAPMLPSSPQHWIAFYAAARLGAIHAGINVMYGTAEIEYQLADCGARTVITLDAFYPHFEALRRTLPLDNIVVTSIRDLASPEAEVYPGLRPLWDLPKAGIPGTTDFVEAMHADRPAPPKPEIDPANDVAQIVYTAGTTGRSKGALQSHRSLVFNSITHALACRTREPPINYTVLPMFHTGGFFLWALPTFSRGGTVLPSPIFDPEDALKQIETHGVTALFGPPTLYAALLRQPRFSTFDLSSLEVTACGAAPVPAGLVSSWEESTGVPLHVGWGMTELNTMGTWSGLPGKPGPGTIGVPMVGEAKVAGDDGRVLPRGQGGELLYRGLQAARGYLNKPDETAATFLPDGWVRTGDLASMDGDGFLRFIDRKKDLIIASGYNIAPVEIEYMLLENPSVLEAAVVGAPDAYRGETVKAFVVLKPEFRGQVGSDDIVAFCRVRMAAYKVPTIVELRDELPKNALGKTLRRVLRAESKG